MITSKTLSEMMASPNKTKIKQLTLINDPENSSCYALIGNPNSILINDKLTEFVISGGDSNDTYTINNVVEYAPNLKKLDIIDFNFNNTTLEIFLAEKLEYLTLKNVTGLNSSFWISHIPRINSLFLKLKYLSCKDLQSFINMNRNTLEKIELIGVYLYGLNILIEMIQQEPTDENVQKELRLYMNEKLRTKILYIMPNKKIPERQIKSIVGESTHKDLIRSPLSLKQTNYYEF
ncbi:uncharacterized protein [Chelonus insularis]|uniref:uncharacterized protein isoform X2 n=1 Tax=Chelonus insularis TaxID=460826 RepID=UPI00158B3B2A|nr:uncharacterized protein LOC118064634 isoform X2 [Chelonus insularis]